MHNVLYFSILCKLVFFLLGTFTVFGAVRSCCYYQRVFYQTIFTPGYPDDQNGLSSQATRGSTAFQRFDCSETVLSCEKNQTFIRRAQTTEPGDTAQGGSVQTRPGQGQPAHPQAEQENEEVWRFFLNKGRGYWNNLPKRIPSKKPIPPVRIDSRWEKRDMADTRFTSYYHRGGDLKILLSHIQGRQNLFSDKYTYDNWVMKSPHEFRPFFYENWFSTELSAIIAVNNRGVLPKNDEVPAASENRILDRDNYYYAPTKWSDFVFARWVTLHLKEKSRDKKKVQELKYIVQFHVANEATQYTMQKAIDRAEQKITLAGIQYCDLYSDNPSEDFLALLGSPNGSGTAKLILNYFESFTTTNQLGQIGKYKSVEKITVLAPEDRDLGLYHLAFTLKDEDFPSSRSVTRIKSATYPSQTPRRM